LIRHKENDLFRPCLDIDLDNVEEYVGAEVLDHFVSMAVRIVLWPLRIIGATAPAL